MFAPQGTTNNTGFVAPSDGSSNGPGQYVPGPHNLCKLTDITGGTIDLTTPFQNMPDSINDTDQANWSQTEIMYRKGPLLGYSSSGNRTINFTLMFYASINQGDGGSVQRVKEQVDRLKASQYPDYDQWQPPHKFRLILGNLCTLEGYITNVTVEWMAPFDHSTVIPLVAEVSIGFEECTEVPKSASDMALGRQPVNRVLEPGRIANNPSIGEQMSNNQKDLAAGLSNGELGALASQYETNGRGSTTIAKNPNDTLGGASYGTYQFSAKTGSAQAFAKNYYPDTLGQLEPGSDAWDAKWLELATNDPNFSRNENSFAGKEFYDPILKSSVGQQLDLANRSKAVQEAIWSTGVQHGGYGGQKVLQNAMMNNGLGADATDAQLIAAIYEERGREGQTKNGFGPVWFASSPKLWNSARNRMLNEKATALAMLQKEKGTA